MADTRRRPGDDDLTPPGRHRTGHGTPDRDPTLITMTVTRLVECIAIGAVFGAVLSLLTAYLLIRFPPT